MKASPKLDKILAVSSILSPPFDKCSSSGLSVKVRPQSWEIAKKKDKRVLKLDFSNICISNFPFKGVPLS